MRIASVFYCEDSSRRCCHLAARGGRLESYCRKHLIPRNRLGRDWRHKLIVNQWLEGHRPEC